TLNQAYKTAITGRPGPVFVYIPLDILYAEVEGQVTAPRALTSRVRADSASIDQVADMIRNAERPLVIAGGGAAFSAGAPESLKSFVEQTGIPVVTTLTAKGVISEEHELSFGPVGRSGSPAAAEAARSADLLISLGARFSDNNTSNWRAGKVFDVPRTKIVQIDIDVAELGRTYPVDVGILGDVDAVLTDIRSAIDGESLASRWQDWRDRLAPLKREWEEEVAGLLRDPGSPIHPARIMHEVGEAIASSGRVYIDIGDSISYAEAYMTIRRPG